MEKQNNNQFGIMLFVLFDNKHLIKAAGAKWNGDDGKSYWYCPSTISKENMLILLELQKRDVVVFVKNIRKTGPTNFYSTGLTHDAYSEDEINLLFVEHRMKQDGEPQMPQPVFKKPYVKYVKKEYVKPVKKYENINFDSDSDSD